ncbi:MAG: hypothetical protein J6X45_05775 [Lachnospiraceae bacterium]|nr:hypothetical protein [Lachnospiraceae bacterium]
MVKVGDYQQSINSYSTAKTESKEKSANVGYVNEKKESGLSEKAQKLLNKLRSTYTNVDFMVADSDTGDEAKQVLSQYTREYSVLLTTDEIEKMASDEQFEKEYLSQIETAIGVTDNINEQYDLSQSFESKGGYTVVSKYGVMVDADGKATLFADLNKLSDAQKEYLEKHREKVKEEKKAEEAKAEKKEAEERLEEIAEEADPFDEPVEKSVRIEASNIHELLEKIKNLNWDDVAPNNATVGTNFDFTA